MPSPNNKLAQIQPVQITDNVRFLFGALTGDMIEKLSGGKIKKMTPQQAAGLIGSWVVETGKPGLQNLDVVERGRGLGRGISQYTGARRSAYDRARQNALARGENPNTAQWQLKYFIDEYTGKHDPRPGASLIGYTRVLESAPKTLNPAQAAQYYTGSAAAGKGYFRPSEPHVERRAAAAQQIFNALSAPPKPAAPPAPQGDTWFRLPPLPNPWKQSLEIPRGPYTPVRFDDHMKQLVPSGSQYHQTPVRYDQQMKMFAPVRQA